jgi:hypothetical protein
MKFCTNCGVKISEDHKFCSECGTPVGVSAARPQETVKTEAVQTPAASVAPIQTAPPPSASFMKKIFSSKTFIMAGSTYLLIVAAFVIGSLVTRDAAYLPGIGGLVFPVFAFPILVILSIIFICVKFRPVKYVLVGYFIYLILIAGVVGIGIGAIIAVNGIQNGIQSNINNRQFERAMEGRLIDANEGLYRDIEIRFHREVLYVVTPNEPSFVLSAGRAVPKNEIAQYTEAYRHETKGYSLYVIRMPQGEGDKESWAISIDEGLFKVEVKPILITIDIDDVISRFASGMVPID